jgi:hypothetical protein
MRWVGRIRKREKYKITPYGLPDLQLAHFGTKMHLEVLEVCQKNNLLLTIKFH